MSDKILEALNEQKKAIEENFSEVKDSVKDLNTRVTELETNNTPRKVSLPGLEDEKEQFSFLRAVNAIRSHDWSHAGFEKEVFDETRKRTAMAQGTDSIGGYIVPDQYINDLIELLRAESVVMRAGATVLDNLTSSPVDIPYQATGSTAYWVAENSAITESNPTLGQIQLTPHACAALVKLSNRLIRLSNPSAEAMVRRDIATALALKIDLAALEGSGTGAEPTGLFNLSGVGDFAIGANGGTFTYDHAIELEGDVDVANALRGRLGFIMHPIISRKLKALKIANYSGQSTNQPYYFMPMSDDNLSNALGYPFYKTTQVSIVRGKGTSSDCSVVYFGNWEEMLIGQWGGLEIMASDVAGDDNGGAFTSNQTWIRAIQEVDVNVRHAASFSMCKDARTN